jgi:hypothetical protein
MIPAEGLMIRRCPACQRVNPSDATFCFFDGKPLASSAGGNASIDFAGIAFPRPFVFRSGARCDNFRQLALACASHAEETVEALRSGLMGSFFGGMGRADLARAVKTLAAMSDAERALDELLGKLPGSALRPAELVVEPITLNLGMVQMGEDRAFTLKLANKGNRLLYGKALVGDCPWLVLGESGTPEKLFQFFESATLQVRIPGKRLHAFAKAQKGEITIESSGGNVVVTVEILVPVKRFPDGVLAGAASPRQFATLAKTHLKEAAVLLEKGAVARWYADNGWTYPVQGPTAHGIAAVQQLFEYLGLVKPPKVELNELSVSLQGRPGERIEYMVRVTTKEKRAVFAHAKSDQSWCKVCKTLFRGETAKIPLLVEAVPDEPGKTLKAHVKVTANGNQHFDVEVSLGVAENAARAVASRDEPEFPFFASAFDDDAPDASPFADLMAPAEEPSPPVADHRVADHWALTQPDSPIAQDHRALTQPGSPIAQVSLLPPLPPPVADAPGSPSTAGEPGRVSARWLIRLLWVPVAVLALLIAVGLATLFRAKGGAKLPDVDYDHPPFQLRFHEDASATDRVPAASMRFGLGVLDPKNPSRFKSRLIYDDKGRTCNVCIRIDNKRDFLLGVEQGAWKPPIRQPLEKDTNGQEPTGAKSVWVCRAPKIVITQHVEIVPEGLSVDGNKRLLDTCLVRYEITNEDTAAHQVGLRFLLDTFVGEDDGMPFAIAGENELCNTLKAFDKPEDVTDFLAALERPDLKNHGWVALLQMRHDETMEPPDRVTLGAWPGDKVRVKGKLPPKVAQLAQEQNTRWEVPLAPMTIDGDSAVTMYWLDRELRPQQKRTVGFAYGLGTISVEKGKGQLGVIAGGEMMAGKEFSLSAYVKSPSAETTATLTLPRGLTLADGSDRKAVSPVPEGSGSPFSLVTWRIRALHGGVYRVTVSLSNGATAEHRVAIRPSVSE